MTYQIQAGEGIKDAIYTPRGGCKDFLYCKEPEYIAAGPAETGKTLAACWKIHLLALKYPGLNGAIIRKTQKSLYGSVLQTWERVIKDAPVTPYGGEKPEKYLYNNGSTIWVGGMDNSDKVLSSERDFFFVNQAEELTLDDWEKLTTRTTGRGAVMPYTMTFGDCNPSGSHHWIRTRPTLKLIHTTHKDNPTLYDDKGELTEHGKRAMDALSSLSGVRRKRLYEGIWATSEGAVYDMFDAAVHVKERDDKEFVSWGLAMDAGYTHPAVILLIGIDSDGRWHVAREFYERGKLQEDVVKVAKAWMLEKDCRMVAVDEAAAGLIADLRNNGVPAQGGKGKVFGGITSVQDRLKIQGDGLPRLSVAPACVNVVNEFESYVWKPEKDEPIKENDHAMDALRYFGDALGEHTWWMSSGDK
jgi:PBSX family phage terminase large subunit